MKKRIFILFAVLVGDSFGRCRQRRRILLIYAALDEKTPREIIKAFKERIGLDADLPFRSNKQGQWLPDQTEAKKPEGRCLYRREIQTFMG